MFTKIKQTARSLSHPKDPAVFSIKEVVPPVNMVTAITRLVVTAGVWILGGYILLTPSISEDIKKWATGLIGTSLGYWLG